MARAARSPDAEATTVDDIIGMLDELDAAGLGRVAEAAQQLRSAKQQAEREAFIARVREEAAAIGLVPEQLFAPVPGASRKQASMATRKLGNGVVAAQFKGPDGATWSGRGKTPGWLAELEKQGRSRDEFRVKEGQPDLMETAKREHEEAA
jgi:DNA-binding protein H-NS